MYNENSVSSLFDQSLIAAPPQSYISKSGDFENLSSEQFARDLGQTQERLQSKFQQPQHLMDQQVQHYNHEFLMHQVPPESQALSNLDFGKF